MNIGIIGQGFVGNAIFQKFRHFYNVLTYDLQSKLCNSILNEIYTSCQYIFICLPTPMNNDGSCYIKIVEDELSKLNTYCQNKQQEKVVIIKSTITPGTTSKWNKKFSNLTIVFNPEFLTEANAVKDYENQNRIILGGPRKGTTPLKPVFSKVFPKAKIIKTDSTHAEMVKYTINCFLATKVSFANEIYQICNGLDIDYDKVIEYAVYDDRLGYSHWAVPGPDGDFGYGGPKDVKALKSLAWDIGCQPRMLEATDSKNNDIRTNRDWENMTGRAII